MDLKEFSKEVLQAELNRREEEKRLAEKPYPLLNPNLTALKRAVVEYIDSIYNGTFHEDSDIDDYIFEEAVKAIYGEKIFKWIGKNT